MPHLSWGILSVSKPPDRRPNRRGRVKMVNVEVKSFSTPDTIKELPEGTGEARTVEFHTRSVTQLWGYPHRHQIANFGSDLLIANPSRTTGIG